MPRKWGQKILTSGVVVGYSKEPTEDKAEVKGSSREADTVRKKPDRVRVANHLEKEHGEGVMPTRYEGNEESRYKSRIVRVCGSVRACMCDGGITGSR